MLKFLAYVLGPRLYRVHGPQPVSKSGKNYEATGIESFCDITLTSASVCWSFAVYTSPFLLAYLWRSGYFTVQGVPVLFRLTNAAIIIVCGAIFLRGIGRSNNPVYRKFIDVHAKAKESRDNEPQRALRQYDFDFSQWPVDFRWSDSKSESAQPLGLSLEEINRIQRQWTSKNLLSRFFALPCDMMGYVAMHTFGRWIIYPGHTSALKSLVAQPLMDGRAKLVEGHHGYRAKLETKDGNHIDTLVIDRRGNSKYIKGNKLVICFEGNAGFYEIGCVVTPIEAGYSVLGWNHPGFGSSTGTPYPSQEQAAVEVVMRYAIDGLGFPPEDILLFAWSIGGYASTFAAMNYPSVSGIVLDATFDDIVPLGLAKMPESMKNFSRVNLRKYMNLNVGEQLIRYPGPIRIVRRTKDEVIITSELPDMRFNRANDLVVKLLQHRYPTLVDSESLPLIKQYVYAKDQLSMMAMYSQLEVDDVECLELLKSYAEENSSEFPMRIGEGFIQTKKVQVALFLISKYLVDFEATHCTPLPAPFFDQPWSVDNSGFVDSIYSQW